MKTIILPCDVGDTIYWLREHKGNVAVIPCKVEGFLLDVSGWKCAYRVIHVSGGRTVRHVTLSEFGRTIFCTAEDAEKILHEERNLSC
jgi:hypothetical protein